MPGQITARCERTLLYDPIVGSQSRAMHFYRRGTPMPLVTVKLIEGVFSEPQKHEMVRKITDALVSIEGESMRSVTWVVLEEIKSGDWGMGGQAITTADVKRLAAAKPAA